MPSFSTIPGYPNSDTRKKTPLHDLIISGLATGGRDTVSTLLSACDPPILSSPHVLDTANVELGVPIQYKQAADAVIDVRSWKDFCDEEDTETYETTQWDFFSEFTKVWACGDDIANKIPQGMGQKDWQRFLEKTTVLDISEHSIVSLRSDGEICFELNKEARRSIQHHAELMLAKGSFWSNSLKHAPLDKSPYSSRSFFVPILCKSAFLSESSTWAFGLCCVPFKFPHSVFSRHRNKFKVLVEVKTEMQSVSATLEQMNRYFVKLFGDANSWDLSVQYDSEARNRIYPLAPTRVLICPSLEPYERATFISQGISVFTNAELVMRSRQEVICTSCINANCLLARTGASKVYACADYLKGQLHVDS